MIFGKFNPKLCNSSFFSSGLALRSRCRTSASLDLSSFDRVPPSEHSQRAQASPGDLPCGAAENLNHALFESLLAHCDSVRRSNQISILEFDSGALRTIIKENIHALRPSLSINLFRRLTYCGIIHFGSGEDCFKGREGRGKKRAALFVVLPRGGAQYTFQPDTIR